MPVAQPNRRVRKVRCEKSKKYRMQDLKPLKIKGNGEALKGFKVVAGIISSGVLEAAGSYVKNECKKVVSPKVPMSSRSD